MTLLITVHHYVTLLITVHHYVTLLITVHHCVTLLITVHHCLTSQVEKMNQQQKVVDLYEIFVTLSQPS